VRDHAGPREVRPFRRLAHAGDILERHHDSMVPEDCGHRSEDPLNSGWWFGADRQRQRLDGSTVKRLVISRWSVFTARLQIRVTNDTAVIYVVEAGDVANLPPGISF
jgi:hypothetical protein